LKVEKYDEPIQKLILDLISGLQITKLVMGFTFMKSSSWYAFFFCFSFIVLYMFWRFIGEFV
jgi:hypothetical protein